MQVGGRKVGNRRNEGRRKERTRDNGREKKEWCAVCRTGDMNAGNKQMMINYVQR